MHLIQHPNSVANLLALYDKIRRAPIIEQRGQLVKHVRDVAIVMNANVPPITNFRARNLNLDYAKQEWLWYLRADKMDASIMDHASMWQKLQQSDGSFYSNYGQYLFRQPGDEELADSQFDYVIKTLMEDPGSRRASMVLLARDHLFPENTDVVCTYAISFSIENGYLEMTVMMRSNDVVFGFTNDAFAFWNLYMFVYTILKEGMPNLQVGSYTHFANSMHVYEKHFKMLETICADGAQGFKPIKVPTVTAAEVADFINHRDGEGEDGSYTAWLKAKS